MDNIISNLKYIKSQAINQCTSGIVTIPIREIRDMAKKYNLSSLQVEIKALQNDIMPERYLKNYAVVSFAEQAQLLSSSTAIIGCGGLGGSVIEMLARLGIGNLIVVDGDIFNESNLNRQSLSAENIIGKEKAEIAAERIKHINSSIHCQPYSQFVDTNNVDKIIRGADLVIDALDNIPSRFVVEKACRELGIPFIHGAVNELKGQVMTIFPQDKGLEVIYNNPAQMTQNENEKSDVSVLAPAPNLVASFQVTEAIKVLLNRGNVLRNKLLLINMEDMDINLVEIK